MGEQRIDLSNYPIWHPFSQMAIEGIPEKVVKAQKNTLYLEDGTELLDAVSSWWVNPWGHGRPELAKAIHDQVLQLDHVIFAGYRHEPGERLSHRILDLLGSPFSKVFFSDNGSTAVEVGLKMAIQSAVQQGEENITIMTLNDGYHGDTFGSMSAGRNNGFFDPFKDFLFDVVGLPLPGTEEFKAAFDAALERPGVKVFLFEPLVLGAGGMQMYAPEAMDDFMAKCKQQGVITIADEVMTGFGRTGKMFAHQWSKYTPDIVCLSKCLTGGIMPMSLTVTHDGIFDAFLSEDKGKAFLHGHSYTGNPVGCAASNASLDLYEAANMEAIWAKQAERYAHWKSELEKLPAVEECSFRGMIFTVRLKSNSEGYFSAGAKYVGPWAREHGVLLRPLGNVVYLLPPFSFEEADFQRVYAAFQTIAKGWEALLTSPVN